MNFSLYYLNFIVDDLYAFNRMVRQQYISTYNPLFQKIFSLCELGKNGEDFSSGSLLLCHLGPKKFRHADHCKDILT